MVKVLLLRCWLEKKTRMYMLKKTEIQNRLKILQWWLSRTDNIHHQQWAAAHCWWKGHCWYTGASHFWCRFNACCATNMHQLTVHCLMGYCNSFWCTTLRPWVNLRKRQLTTSRYASIQGTFSSISLGLISSREQADQYCDQELEN